MATVDQVCSALQAAVISLLNSSGVDNPPNQVGIGWPFGVSLSEILGQSEAQVSIYPLTAASKLRTDRKPRWKNVTTPVVPLIATLAADGSTRTITFSGSVIAGLNVHAIPNANGDGYYQTQTGDTLSTVATAVKNAINALALPGVSASAAGNVVTVAGAPHLACNVGGTNSMVQEIARVMLPVQISVWAADGPTRNSMSAQIENGLCLGITTAQNFLYASDGSAIRVRKRGAPSWTDESQSSYSLYESHIVYECEYPSLETAVGAQVGVVVQRIDTQIGSVIVDGPTTYDGGP